MLTRLALGLYRCLLAFYPTGFRTEFEAEMKAVFIQALGDQRASRLGYSGESCAIGQDWCGAPTMKRGEK